MRADFEYGDSKVVGRDKAERAAAAIANYVLAVADRDGSRALSFEKMIEALRLLVK